MLSTNKIVLSCRREVVSVKMVRMLIQVPLPLKRKLDALRAQGYTAAGYVRNVLERHFDQVQAPGKKGR